MRNKLSLFLGFILLASFNFACSSLQAKSDTPNPGKAVENRGASARRITSSSRLGIETVYYKIPSGMSREELIEVAQKLLIEEPRAGLILVDDDSKVNEYVEFATIINPGYNDPEMPKEWADKHIIANVQIYLSGRVMLCEGYGYKEIAELE